MAEYKFEVTGDMLLAHTYDNIYVTLIGSEGESERTNLNASCSDLKNRTTQAYKVTTEKPLGRLLLVKIEKEHPRSFLPEFKWSCSKIIVTTPEDDVILFPCYGSVTTGEPVELRGGKATTVSEDELPLLVDLRKKELKLKQQLYQWIAYAEGLPQLSSIKEVTALPAEAQFSNSKKFQVALTKASITFELQMKGYEESTEKWKNFEEMKKVFWLKKTKISDYVSQHWKEDDFYGYQFLNGTNPNVIQRCSRLPPNFPVTEKMVRPSLEKGTSLAAELQKGNIFLCDYKKLEGLTTRVVNDKPLPLVAALCLFYKTPQNKLLPIAIQLGQKPSEPIFLPSDSEHDWLLAKIFVRNADFIEHQLSYHLLNTHFLAEVFALATLRNLPAVHPLYKFCYRNIMAEFNLQMTGDILHYHTLDNLYVTLIGPERQSERTKLNSFGFDFQIGQTRSYTVTTVLSLGFLLLLELENDPHHELPDKEWYCSKMVVTAPDGDVILFPVYRWLSRGELVVLRGGRATKAFEDDHPRMLDQRKKELALQKRLYQWNIYAEGMPHGVNVGPTGLPPEVRFSFSTFFEFVSTFDFGMAEVSRRGLANYSESWESLEAMKKVFWFDGTPVSDYVSEHWMEDDLFGYQFLNGANPYVIQRCSELPSNFPVTEEMVRPFLASGSSLAMEMKKGNIFLCDYRGHEGVPTRVINGERVPAAAPLCLSYMNPESRLLPIAIQLGQQPSEKNPIFLPSDSEYDWLLAKIFVRHVDTLQHEIVEHLLRAHFLAGVYTMATLRNLPMIHPLYKLLIPHHRYTLQINVLGKTTLLHPDSFIDNSTLGLVGSMALMSRALSETTYNSLCLPENIATRGLESVPNFYYREDGLRVWNIINGFVRAMVEYYYSLDSEVSSDSELQAWIDEIFNSGFLQNGNSGIPDEFHTVEEVIKFVTMVIYTSSAHHSAIGRGQLDYFGCVPNGPSLLRKGPPTTKGQSSLETILDTLPDKGNSAMFAMHAWGLSKKCHDFIPLGTYPDEHFDEPACKQMIKVFQAELSDLSKAIAQRNSELEVPYDYLNPNTIENSVTI